MSKPTRVIDYAVIELLLSLGEPGDRSLLVELIELWLHGATESLKKINAAHTSGDRKKIAYEAHQLKSSSGNLGASHVSESALALEKAALGSSLAADPAGETLFPLIAELTLAIAAASPELRSLAIGHAA